MRAELARAQDEGAASDWRFSVEQVSLEFSVQLHRAGEGGAGHEVSREAPGQGGLNGR
ncbi:trypco2 family protein [Streptomyces bluensis]|uniref:trypco2 family protein n=1 Tax=Streptomyces bluensis TaxID=33897 RepID=UPI003EC0B9A2